ncbi:hypothetical protein [Pontiella sulfatireligans]|uniref:CBM6 domain-containing protein n=1 Tax=Pontiella sulfatireligans TaxID=2750658 RepID=A0A6C2UNJ4_9BACT|nr:hypothetical protein [Pontiella sulfatireligans]VGO21513.1 hypothetical protein SCARR_03587 [Pontiella sulfatireligans]
MKKTIALFAVFSVCCSFAAPVFEGKDGLLIIEAESTKSSKGDWEKEKSVEGYTGECHFEFTGNQPASGPAADPLEYRFTVDKDGEYRLLIRAHKRLDGEPGDRCNDCYIRLMGDFDTAGKAPLDMLKSDTKLYGGDAKGWGWTAQLDKHHKKFPPLYKLKAGEKYTLIISGRSQRFNMDRIIFKHKSVGDAKAKDPKQPESKPSRK